MTGAFSLYRHGSYKKCLKVVYNREQGFECQSVESWFKTFGSTPLGIRPTPRAIIISYFFITHTDYNTYTATYTTYKRNTYTYIIYNTLHFVIPRAIIDFILIASPFSLSSVFLCVMTNSYFPFTENSEPLQWHRMTA